MDARGCPVCGQHLRESQHLAEAFAGDTYGYWMARSVCHWRHEHLASYDRAWRSPAYARKVPAYAAMGHDAFKAMVNERAKRQLIRGVVKSALPRVDKVGLILAVDRLEHKDPATMRLKDDALRRLGVQAAPRPEAPIEAWRGRA